MAGVLAIAVPVTSASAAPSAPTGGQPFTSPSVDQLAQPFRDGWNNAVDGYQRGANSVYDGWQAGWNSVFDGYQHGAQAALDGWTADMNKAVEGWRGLQDAANALRAQASANVPAELALYPAPIWHPTGD
jgi:hypothetical protein